MTRKTTEQRLSPLPVNTNAAEHELSTLVAWGNGSAPSSRQQQMILLQPGQRSGCLKTYLHSLPSTARTSSSLILTRRSPKSTLCVLTFPTQNTIVVIITL